MYLGGVNMEHAQVAAWRERRGTRLNKFGPIDERGMGRGVMSLTHQSPISSTKAYIGKTLTAFGKIFIRRSGTRFGFLFCQCLYAIGGVSALGLRVIPFILIAYWIIIVSADTVLSNTYPILI